MSHTWFHSLPEPNRKKEVWISERNTKPWGMENLKSKETQLIASLHTHFKFILIKVNCRMSGAREWEWCIMCENGPLQIKIDLGFH